MGWLAALVGLASPVVARVLLSLGFTVLTIAGVTTVMAELKTRTTDALGGIPHDALQLAGLAGVWPALGMVFAACTFVATLWGLTKAVRITGAA